jgi:predicted nucleic acid-binding protein
LHIVTASDINRAWILFQQRASAGWSFTDCTSKIVIDQLGITKAITLDAHFQQFGIVVAP